VHHGIDIVVATD